MVINGELNGLTFCLGITTYAESKTSQAGITFTGDGSIDVSVTLQKRIKKQKKYYQMRRLNYEMKKEQ
ncbi:hypothetical protein ODV97_19350 [Enterococcus gallinarum]|nr:hypothetical protein [Enterococcus gallinarum]